MSFGAPQWLWLLVALPALAWLATGLERRRWLTWQRFAGAGTRGRIERAQRRWSPLLRWSLVLTALALLIIAAARPRWGAAEPELVRARGLDLFLVMDASVSMRAEDVRPSRLFAARALARNVARLLPQDRIGLIGFAGSAGLLCPLTLDRGALDLYLDALDPEVFPAQGTDVGAAIDLAVRSLQQLGRTHRAILVISDGEDHGMDATAAAARALDAGVRVFTATVGSESAPLSLPTDPASRGQRGAREYLRDGEGRIVQSRPDPLAMARLAARGGGVHVDVRGLGGGETEMITALGAMARGEFEELTRPRQKERYRWPLALAFLLLLADLSLVDRRAPVTEGAR